MQMFDEILHGVEHRFCLRHLYNNYKKKFGARILIRNLMMGTAKATYYQGWKAKMEDLKKVNLVAYEWLVGIPLHSWCNHAFNVYPRFDVLMNNLSESFNNTILLARDKPIITMMEWIRSYLMTIFVTLREKFAAYPGAVMPKPSKRLDREVEKSGNWIAVWSGDGIFEVTQGFTIEKFDIDLTNVIDIFGTW